MSGLDYQAFLWRIRRGALEGLKFLNPTVFAVHHRDRRPEHNTIDNLEVLTHDEHQRLHGNEETVRNVLFAVQHDRVSSVERSGEEMTYDLELCDEPHNFIANGFVVHNSGKTTTIIEGINHAPEGRILLAAFNKRIQEELATRIQNPAATAQTAHSVGYACVRRFWEHVQVAPGQDRVKSLTQAVCGDQAPDAIKRLVSALCTKGREVAPHATEPGSLVDIAVTFDCMPDDAWERLGFGLDYVENKALEAMRFAAEQKPVNGIDFSDMLFLPVRNRWLVRQFDLCVIDEAQDMTATQLELLRGVCGGRVALVGDDRQGIYRFRGADSTSLDRLKAELDAAELGLTVTYRCGKLIAAAAARLVPDLVAHPSSPDGEITALPSIERLLEEVGPNDFVLSRVNAPLVRVAMALVRARKKVRIQGRDIGAGLKALMHTLAMGRAKESIPAFIDKVRGWESREVERALRMDREDKAEQVRDKAQTLLNIIDGATGVPDVEARLDALFSDAGNGGCVVCSSVHRAKGLEADRVFVLRDTLYPARPMKAGKKRERTAEEQQEEANIEYVAITRAKQHLVWVSGR